MFLQKLITWGETTILSSFWFAYYHFRISLDFSFYMLYIHYSLGYNWQNLCPFQFLGCLASNQFDKLFSPKELLLKSHVFSAGTGLSLCFV